MSVWADEMTIAEAVLCNQAREQMKIEQKKQTLNSLKRLGAFTFHLDLAKFFWICSLMEL